MAYNKKQEKALEEFKHQLTQDGMTVFEGEEYGPLFFVFDDKDEIVYYNHTYNDADRWRRENNRTGYTISCEQFTYSEDVI